jgi:hypothetical protein
MHEFNVSLFISMSYQFFDGSGILRGLSDLACEGAIRLKLRGGGVFDPSHRGLVRFDVTKADGGGMRRVVIDLADQAGQFSPVALDQVDIYFKRSFSRARIQALPLAQQGRVRPYGLNLACLGVGAAHWHVRAAAIVFAQRASQRKSVALRSAVREFIAHCGLTIGLPSPAAFASRRSAGPQRVAILQTRIWPPEQSPEDLQRINSERIALVQILKATLRSRFVGGILADSFSESICPPELLVRQSKKRGAYLKLVTSASIGIYVRGLHNAIAIKMAEYLAAGLCIVSEPLQYELPVPLVAGVNYLEFRSREECVSQCEWLLVHPAEAERMRTANLDYYARWVEPRAHVYDLLSRSFE